MVASIKWTIEARERIHNLNLSVAEHQEYYNVILEDFIWQNESFWDDIRGERRYKSYDGKIDIRKVHQDIYGYRTVGVGFNMDDVAARKEWSDAFGGTISFNDVRGGIRILSDEEVLKLFRQNIKSRREQLIKHFTEKVWEELKPNERLAIEDLYFNGGPRLATKCGGIETNFSQCIKRYGAYGEKKDLEAAVKEVRYRSNSKKQYGLQQRREVEAIMLASYESAVYSMPGNMAIPKKSKA